MSRGHTTQQGKPKPTENRAAARATLGGMLIDTEQIAPVLQLLEARDFSEPKDRVLFQTIADMYAAGEICGQEIDLVLLEARLQRNGQYNAEIGELTRGIINACPNSLRTMEYAGVVLETALERKKQSIGMQLLQGDLSTDEAQEALQRLEDRHNGRKRRATDEDNSLLALSSQPSFPSPPRPEAFYGLAGDIVAAIEPHTEADPVALLTQFLVAFGNAAGRHAYFRVEADRHYPNLFAVLVGDTAKGRKGTSWGQIRWRLFQVASSWTSDHILSGLSSGEGLIHTLRDVADEDPALENEPLLRDKRLLIQQGEFASVLKMLTREGNILSDILREAWDGVTLRTLTKFAAEKATQTHISILGHITRNELTRMLNETEAANGFGNRFLWICVKRSKLLPDGGALDTVDFSALDKRLEQALAFAQMDPSGYGREVTRDPEARQLWHQEYERLSEGQPGLLGSMTARAEAQVMRLAMLYALLDCSAIVRVEHLRAALALWDYCETSARYIFGDAIGDPTADTILQSLRASPGGLTRTEISNLFGRHRDAAKVLVPALKRLLSANLARLEMEQTDGRPAERWYAVLPTQTRRRAEAKEAKEAPRVSPVDVNSHNSLNAQAQCPICGGVNLRDYGDGVLRCIACDVPAERQVS